MKGKKEGGGGGGGKGKGGGNKKDRGKRRGKRRERKKNRVPQQGSNPRPSTLQPTAYGYHLEVESHNVL